MFEERLRLLEGAEDAAPPRPAWPPSPPRCCRYLKAGDHIVAARALFGSCRYIVETLCPRFGIASTLSTAATSTPGARRCAPTPRCSSSRRRPTRRSSSSTSPPSPSSPSEIGALVVVDNVFATPMLQRPLAHGADIVVYSATKHIDGQGRCLGGAVLGSKDFVTNHLQDYLRQTGPSMSPFNAWVMLKGLETLPVRVKAQCATAAKIADHLAGQPGRRRASSTPAAPTIRRPHSPSGR